MKLLKNSPGPFVFLMTSVHSMGPVPNVALGCSGLSRNVHQQYWKARDNFRRPFQLAEYFYEL